MSLSSFISKESNNTNVEVSILVSGTSVSITNPILQTKNISLKEILNIFYKTFNVLNNK